MRESAPPKAATLMARRFPIRTVGELSDAAADGLQAATARRFEINDAGMAGRRRAVRRVGGERLRDAPLRLFLHRGLTGDGVVQPYRLPNFALSV